ncbi:MAG: transposase [Candidatus Thermoplasmatota archaeon]|nr:transposase [Candidatus Thermoplasmatota archaeon]
MRENHLTQKLIRPHTPDQSGIVERANKTMRESLVTVILTDCGQ